MPFVDPTMTVVRQTWQVSTFSARFILLACLVAGINLKQRDGTARLDRLTYVGDIIMQQRKPLVYGLVFAGLIRAIAAPSVQFHLSTAVVTAFLGYALYRTYQDPPDRYDLTRGEALLFLPLYVVGIVAALGSVVTSSVLLNSLAAVALFSIIFWRI